MQFNRVLEIDKVEMATMNMDAAADNWYQSCMESIDALSWKEFEYAVTVRFSVQPHRNIEGEFGKLGQRGTVQEYQQQFEELMALMLRENPGLTERYYINHFICGLKPAIRDHISMLFAKSLTATISLAKMQENNLETQLQSLKTTQKAISYTTSVPKNNYSYKPYPYKPTRNTINSPTKTITPYTPTTKPYTNRTIPIKRLTQEEMKARRDKGLCYNCDEVFHMGHRCKSQQIFMIIGDVEEACEDAEIWHDSPDTIDESTDQRKGQEEVTITVHALAGAPSCSAIRLKGKVNGHAITILIDSGCTHNFVKL